MALGTLGAALVTAGVSAGGNLLSSKLSKSKSAPATNFMNQYFSPADFKAGLTDLTDPSKNLVQFNAGGLSSSFNNGVSSVASDVTRQGQVTGVSNAFRDQAAKLGELAAQIKPGASALREAQLSDIENSRRSAIGDLKDNLNRRRVLGSSFAQDAIVRASKDYDQQRAKVIAETYMTELEATHQLTNEQFEATRNQYDTFLKESNLQAGIAGELAAKATDVMASATQLKAKLLASLAGVGVESQAKSQTANDALAAEASKGSGNFWGSLIQPVAKAAGNAVA
jgi:orotidine-5'-phosphate decarboxylase